MSQLLLHSFVRFSSTRASIDPPVFLRVDEVRNMTCESFFSSDRQKNCSR